MHNHLSINSLVLITLCSPILKRQHVLTPRQFHLLEQRIKKSSIKHIMHLLDISKEELMIKLKCNEEEAAQIVDLLDDFLLIVKQLTVYEKQNIYVTTIYEDSYPLLLKERLKKKAPLLLFYTGNYHLIHQSLISLFGPIQLSKTLEDNIYTITEKINEEGYTYLSGNNKGCEQISISQQLTNGGTVVLFTANKLLYLKRKYASYIKEGKLLIMTHQDIDCPYDIAEAIETNNYIYALSYTTIIVYTQYNSGVVWFNAVQNIKSKWCSLLSLIDEEFHGNAKLVELGAVPFTIQQLNDISIEELLNSNFYQKLEEQQLEQLSIFNFIEFEENERSESTHVN